MYETKYLKYKKKYVKLKNLDGGGKHEDECQIKKYLELQKIEIKLFKMMLSNSYIPIDTLLDFYKNSTNKNEYIQQINSVVSNYINRYNQYYANYDSLFVDETTKTFKMLEDPYNLDIEQVKQLNNNEGIIKQRHNDYINKSEQHATQINSDIYSISNNTSLTLQGNPSRYQHISQSKRPSPPPGQPSRNQYIQHESQSNIADEKKSWFPNFG